MIAFRWSTNLFGCLNIDLCANYEAGRMTFSIYQWHRPYLRTSSGIRSFLGLKKKSMPYWIKSLYMCNHLLWSIDNFQSKAPSRIHCIYKQYLSHTNSLLFFEESKMDHQSFFYHVDWDVIVLGVCKWVYNIQIMRGESSTDWETD